MGVVVCEGLGLGLVSERPLGYEARRACAFKAWPRPMMESSLHGFMLQRATGLVDLHALWERPILAPRLPGLLSLDIGAIR